MLADDYAALGYREAAREEALQIERAVAGEPNSAFGYFALAQVLNATGKPKEALVAAETGIRLDSRLRGYCVFTRAWSYLKLGQWENAAFDLKSILAKYPDSLWVHVFLAIDYIELGHEDAARAEAAEALRINPQFSLQVALPAKGPKDEVLAENQRWAADLLKAGLK
jgi:tetratricopeptide (TPR) repeat protein